MPTTDSEIKTTLGSLDPLIVLKKWLKGALKLKTLKDPWAMVLSTAYRGKISSRVVLLKRIRREELFFYTNYLSLKGQCLRKNPRAAVNFYWSQSGQQFCIEGDVKKISRKQSLLYWKTRNRESQLSQWVSKQSQEVSSRKEMQDLKNTAKKIFKIKISLVLSPGEAILSLYKE